MGSRSLTSLLRGRWRAVAIWAMVPLAAIGGRPVLGCVCADGSYKTACPILREAIEHRRCTCCESACEAAASRDQQADCCHDAAPDAEPSLASTNCCHPVVQAPVLPPLGDVASVADDHQLLFDAALVEGALMVGPGRHCRLDDDTGLPTPDLVVTLQRLII